jgi:lysophospholipid acyltransferase (LPLAT)-like uncharacterized protein
MVVLKTFGPSLVGLLGRSWKVELRQPERFDALRKAGGALVCVWHGRMLTGVPLFGGEGHCVLVSPSADGDLSQELLQAFGYRAVRGTAGRSGARTVRMILDVLSEGRLIVITPDGPRGPRHSMKAGLSWMARATGHPLVPLGLVADRAWHMKSWDRFTIPKPRARLIAALGEPIHVPPDTPDEELAGINETVRERTLALERDGFARLGVEPDW